MYIHKRTVCDRFLRAESAASGGQEQAADRQAVWCWAALCIFRREQNVVAVAGLATQPDTLSLLSVELVGEFGVQGPPSDSTPRAVRLA